MLSTFCNSCIKSWKSRKKHSGKITKIKPFINKYNWEGINFPSEKGDWNKIEKNNWIIALNVLYAKKEKIPSCLCFKTTKIVKNELFF